MWSVAKAVGEFVLGPVLEREIDSFTYINIKKVTHTLAVQVWSLGFLGFGN